MASFISRQTFDPTLIGMVLNPYFIVRCRIRDAVRMFAATARGDLLDIGCGSRPYEHHFVGVTSYIGLDIDESGHPNEKKRADVYYDGNRIPFDDCSKDVVLTSEVFEHVFNLDDLVLEIHRVLKPGGKLCVTIPFAFPEHEQPYDFARYTQFGITHILEQGGFRVIKLTKLGTMVHAIGQLRCAYWFGKARSPMTRALFQILFCAPITVLTELKAKLFPRDDRYYCGLVIEAVAEK